MGMFSFLVQKKEDILGKKPIIEDKGYKPSFLDSLFDTYLNFCGWGPARYGTTDVVCTNMSQWEYVSYMTGKNQEAVARELWLRKLYSEEASLVRLLKRPLTFKYTKTNAAKVGREDEVVAFAADIDAIFTENAKDFDSTSMAYIHVEKARPRFILENGYDGTKLSQELPDAYMNRKQRLTRIAAFLMAVNGKKAKGAEKLDIEAIKSEQ